MKYIKISNKNMKLRFHGCDPDYIQSVCHSSCCNSSKYGTMITIHPSEECKIRELGYEVSNGLLVCKDCCVFKKEFLCSLHNTEYKPFGCIVSPFTLNSNDTLIVRNRYKLLKCYEKSSGIPAYIAFKASLELLFEQEYYKTLRDHLDMHDSDIVLPIKNKIYQMLHDNDAIKKSRIHGKT